MLEADQQPSAHLSNNAIAHLMITPALKKGGNVSKMFSTHPPTEERVARLMEMAGGVSHQHETQTEGRAYAGLNLAPPEAQQAASEAQPEDVVELFQQRQEG